MVGTTLTYFGWVNSGTTYTDSFEDYEKLTKIDLNSVTGHTPGDPGSYTGGETISMDVIMKFSVNVSESEQTTSSTSHGITQSFSENNTLTFRYPQNAGLYFAKNNCSVSPVMATYVLTNTNITQSLPTAYLSTTDEEVSPKDVFTVGTVAMFCSDN